MEMIINGACVPASDGQTMDVINPANMQVIDTVPCATVEDMEKALDAAREGYLEWKKVYMYDRVQILKKFNELLTANLEDFAKIMCAETGKPIQACIDETKACMGIFEAYCEKAKNLGGETLPLNSEGRVFGDIIFTLREPLGVVVSIIPFNYPTELYAHKVAPALVTGNAVIVKPCSDTPLGNIYLTKLLLEAGVPKGAIQCVTGSGSKVGNYLASSPKINVVSLTGSCEVGIQTATNAAKNLTHAYLELGGNDPYIIFDDADIDKAVEESLGGRASNAGQTCCGSKRFIVHKKVYDIYVEKLIAALNKLKIGDPMEYDTYFGPLISEKAAIDCENDVAHTIAQGAKCVLGGKRYNHTFFPPTVLVDVTPDMDVANELEIFGPVFPVIPFETVDEAIAIANQIPYGLSSGVQTNDMRIALKVATEIQAGTCVINGCGNYRSAHLAFGGYKKTGIGREGVTETLMEYTQTKNIALKQLL